MSAQKATDMGTTVVLRPVGAPLPVGFLALAVGSMLMAARQLQWVGAEQEHVVALCLLLFVVPLQLVAGVLALISRDAIGGTAMGILAASWAVLATIRLTGPPSTTSSALGILLVSAGAVLASIAFVAATTRRLAAAVIGLSGLRFAAGGLGDLIGGGWATVSAVIGLALTFVAWYAAVAFLTENVGHRAVLPTFRRSDPNGPQPTFTELAGEPGVRTPA